MALWAAKEAGELIAGSANAQSYPAALRAATPFLLANVYLPIVWAAFLSTLIPSMEPARSIQRPLCISTNDHMPFGTGVRVVFAMFLLLNGIYLLIQGVFGLGIRRIIRKKDLSEYPSVE